METKIVLVELFTIPQAACDSGKANWQQVGELVRKQLEIKFGGAIGFKHIEFMSDQWFENTRAQGLLENANIDFPFVLVNGKIACADKKINVSKVIKAIQLILQ